jgi:hypothetical protein
VFSALNLFKGVGVTGDYVVARSKTDLYPVTAICVLLEPFMHTELFLLACAFQIPLTLLTERAGLHHRLGFTA